MTINASAPFPAYPHPAKTFSDKPELTRMLNELDAEEFELFCQTLRQRSIRSVHARNFEKPWINGEISFDSPLQKRNN